MSEREYVLHSLGSISTCWRQTNKETNRQTEDRRTLYGGNLKVYSSQKNELAKTILASRCNVTVKTGPVSTVPGYVVYHQTRDVSGQSLFS